MQYNTLGNSGLKVSAISLGSYHIYDRMSQDEIEELLSYAVKHGVNWFDVGHYTSAVNSLERVSTTDIRFGFAREAAGIKREDYIHTEKLWYGGPRPRFKVQLAESLPRAQVDYADLVIENPDTAFYYQRVDQLNAYSAKHMMMDIVVQMADVIEAGLAKHWGINHATPEQVRFACEFADREGMPKPTVLQIPYNAISRNMAEDKELVKVAQEFDLAYQASNVLAVGVLAGRRIEDAKRPLGPSHMMQAAEKDMSRFRDLAESFGASSAQLAIAFCLSNPQVASTLVGTSKLSQLEDNIGAIDLLERVGADKIRAALADLPQNEHQLKVGDVDDD
ncbi:aldo/keto reductase [Bifidobacterium olomucense]|uniref:Oxidoreductase n=1 Tax=Bifidobacterium olomucense TaxID=2675324 RepID=A0A7Y0EZQ2_9BIFI|nr:aldo/keto reductase [Bifidobacterium sp. DSM 109959]NMM98396.1 oxidoreductase [Bifidobacterium sp. DSM 109959]